MQNTSLFMYTKDKRLQNGIYSSFLLTSNGNIYFGQNQSFRDISSVWKDDLTIRASIMWFQMGRTHTLTPLSPNIKRLNVKT